MIDNGQAVASGIGIILIVGMIAGGWIALSRYSHDEYYCTVKCPNQVKNIEWSGDCYCLLDSGDKK